MPDLFDARPITLDDQIAELRRELRMRRYVYGGQVTKGRMKWKEASRKMALIEAAITSLKTLQDREMART